MPDRPSVLLLSGGAYHPFAATSSLLADHLRSDGLMEVTVTEDLRALEEKTLQNFNVLLLNCMYYTEGGDHISEAQKAGIIAHLRKGKGLVALHAAIASFDDWPEYAKIVGALWDWNKSSHGDYQPGWRIKVADRAHPITQGVEDFEIHDELYHTLTPKAQFRTLLTAVWNDVMQPMAWTKGHGMARVYYNALGHGVETFQNPHLLRLIRQGVVWVAGG